MVGWAVDAHNHSTMALAIIGLVQFAPTLLLTLPAGEVCDRLSAKRVLVAGMALETLCVFGLMVFAGTMKSTLWPTYLILLVLGAARAFTDPASQALLPMIVDRKDLPRAIASGSSVWQMALIAGPLMGGAFFALGPSTAYCLRGLGFIGAT